MRIGSENLRLAEIDLRIYLRFYLRNLLEIFKRYKMLRNSLNHNTLLNHNLLKHSILRSAIHDHIVNSGNENIVLDCNRSNPILECDVL